VRTGVTAIWPRGKQSDDPAFGGWFSLNGNGEMTGTTWLEESGLLDGPFVITNTYCVGVVRARCLRRLGSCSISAARPKTGSGDMFKPSPPLIGNAAKRAGGMATLSMLPNDALGPIFDATVQATEEAIVNALVAAQDMTGVDGHTVTALPHDALQQVLKKYNRSASTR
jgi:L-aminopeptidase/D-esterase-like protein